MQKHKQPLMMTRNAGQAGTPSAIPETPERDQRRDLTVRSFLLRADTINVDERSVEAVIATEAPTMVLDMQRWEVVEEILLASGMTVAAADGQVPLLDTHNRHSVSMQLGSCRGIRAEGTQIIGRNHFSSVADAVDCFTKIQEGHVRDNSVGYQVLNYVTIEPGMTAEIEGRTFTASADRPLRVTTEWMIKENSVCPIGADGNAKMRDEPTAPVPPADESGQRTARIYPNINQMKGAGQMRNYLISLGMRAEATEEEMQQFIAGLTDEQRAAMPVETPAPTPEPIPVPGLSDAQRAAIVDQVRQEQAAVLQAEHARTAAIRTEGTQNGVDSAVIERCILDGMDISAARAEFLTAVRSARPSVSGGPQISVPGKEITSRHLSCGLLMRQNVRQDALLNEFGQDLVQQTSERCRRLSLMDICRAGLAINGHDVPFDRDDMIRAGFSTGTLPTILGDAAHKMLLVGFESAQSTWRQWCSTKSVSDFKNHNLMRFNLNGGLEKVGNGGEVKTFERSEQTRNLSADEYAKNLTITRRDMINDDAGAFMDVAKKLGKKADQGVGDLVYTILLANVLSDGNSTALFSTTAHEDANADAIVNLQTSSALSIATLSAALAKFGKFREFNGDQLDVPAFGILCPPEMAGTARALVSSELIVSGNTTAAAANNPNAGLGLQVISEGRLSNANYTGYSATSWYLVPAANEVDLLSVAFLNGVEVPQLSTFSCGPDYLGAGWQIVYDYGAAATDIYAVKSEA